MTYRKRNCLLWEGIAGQPVMSEAEWQAICTSVVKARRADTKSALGQHVRRFQMIAKWALKELEARSARKPNWVEEHAIPQSWLMLGSGERKKEMAERIRSSERCRLAEQSELLQGLQFEQTESPLLPDAQNIIASAAYRSNKGRKLSARRSRRQPSRTSRSVRLALEVALSAPCVCEFTLKPFRRTQRLVQAFTTFLW